MYVCTICVSVHICMCVEKEQGLLEQKKQGRHLPLCEVRCISRARALEKLLVHCGNGHRLEIWGAVSSFSSDTGAASRCLPLQQYIRWACRFRSLRYQMPQDLQGNISSASRNTGTHQLLPTQSHSWVNGIWFSLFESALWF